MYKEHLQVLLSSKEEQIAGLKQATEVCDLELRSSREESNRLAEELKDANNTSIKDRVLNIEVNSFCFIKYLVFYFLLI